MDFLDISSLGVAYRYVVKIEQKFKQWSKREFGFENMPQQKHGKGNPNSQNKGHIKRKANLKRSSPRHRKRRVMGSLRKTLESGVSSTKSPGTTPMNVTRNSHWWSSSKKKNQNLTQTLIQSTIKGNISSMQNPLLPSWPQQYNQKNQRSLRRGSPLPLIDVGKGDPTAFHC
jgi:hypothetical protein